MAMKRLFTCALLCGFNTPPLLAFEPVTGGFRAATALRASNVDKHHHHNNNNNSHEEENSSFPQLGGLEEDPSTNRDWFTFRYGTIEELNLDPILMPLFASKPILWEPDQDSDEDDFICFGDDCEEDCPIPEEYKTLDEAASIDVMAYLGIRRADPIRLPEKSSSDNHDDGSVWE